MTYRLYLVTDRYDYTDEQFLRIIKEALAAGVTMVQLREKAISTRRYFELAQAVKQLTDQFNVPLIIDDRIDVALAVDAAGVHIGDDELPVRVARQLIGPDKILGVSTKSVEAAQAAAADGANYVGVGAIYPTQTKVITRTTSLATLQEITQTIDIPVVAIGGIKFTNIATLSEINIAGVAIVSGIMRALDVQQAVASVDEALVSTGR